MKKITAIILCLVMVFALVACGGGDNKDKGETKTTSAVAPDYTNFYFESKGVKFGIFDKAETVMNALGEPTGTFESDSCAYQGKDYFYYYDGFDLMVNDIDGVKYITGITLTDDTVANPQGVKIGMKLEDAEKLMGDGFETAGPVCKYTEGSTIFKMTVGDDGTITAAGYGVAANEGLNNQA